jgi:hypothetical protein
VAREPTFHLAILGKGKKAKYGGIKAEHSPITEHIREGLRFEVIGLFKEFRWHLLVEIGDLVPVLH